MKNILICFLLFSSGLKAQIGVFKINGYGNCQIGYNANPKGTLDYKSILLGYNNGIENTSQWGFTHYNSSLRIWKPDPSVNGGLNHFNISDSFGMVGIGMLPWDKTNWSYNGWLNKLWVNGRVIANAYIQYSDSSMKENITLIPKILSKINQLKPVSYQYIFNTNLGQTELLDSNCTDSLLIKTFNTTGGASKLKDSTFHYGLIAQELELIFPQLVVNIGNTKGINYTELVPILIKGMQDQQKEIEDLKAEVQAIKNVTPISTTKTVLYQNDPNPFGTTTKIKYYIDETVTFTLAKIEIRDLTGVLKETINLVDQSGLGEVIFNCQNINNGYYIYSIKLDGSIKDSKMLLVEK